MGYYINPSDTSKEQWLVENATRVMGVPQWKDCPSGHSIICLVQNPMFTAAAICDTERELRAFNDPSDHRPKHWFFVETEKLFAVSDLPG